jgi:hypothetical protein
MVRKSRRGCSWLLAGRYEKHGAAVFACALEGLCYAFAHPRFHGLHLLEYSLEFALCRVSLFLLSISLFASTGRSQSVPAVRPSSTAVPQAASMSPRLQSISTQQPSTPPQQQSLPVGKMLLTEAEFADVTAVPGNPNVEIVLGGMGFQVGMKADFDGTAYDVAVIDDNTASIRVALPTSFDIRAQHRVQLHSASGVDAGFQYLANQLIPRGADLHAQLKADRKETKELARYTKVADKKASAELRANRAKHKMDIAQGKVNKGRGPKSTPANQVVNPTCAPDSTLEQTNIRVRRSVMAPKEASDAFGRRLGRHYIVFQITVENKSADYQYMLHNVSVDLSTLMGAPQGSYEWAFSTQELSMLRGVPEKGQDYDPRNLTLHILRSVGSVAGGVTGLVGTSIQDIFAGSVAGYNGPLLSSFLDIFPDHTATQLNRLSDSAFIANSVVAKRAAKVFAIFVPAELVMTNSQSHDYWENPMNVMSIGEHDFRQADVCVDGAFITEVSSVGLTAIAFADPTKVAPGASVDLIVTGSNLTAGDTELHIFDQVVALSSIDANKATGHATVKLPTSYDFQKSYPAFLESSKTGQLSGLVSLDPIVKPVLTSISFLDASKAVPGASGVVLKLTGSYLVEGDTSLLVFGAELPLQQVSVDRTSAQVTAAIPTSYDGTKNTAATLKTKSGLLSEAGVLPAKTLTLTSASTSAPDTGGKVTLTLTGTGMSLADTQVAFDTGTPVGLTTVSADGTSGTVVMMPLAGWPGTHTAVLQTASRGNSATPVAIK